MHPTSPPSLFFVKRVPAKETAEIISVLFIFLFIYAAFSKLFDVGNFRLQLEQSPLLTRFAGWVAWLIPLLEIAICILLAVSRTRLAGLYGTFMLMSVFTAYIITITHFSEFIPCSCGGILQKMSWNQHLVFNIGMLIIGIVGIAAQTNHLNQIVATIPSMPAQQG